jgi:DivIVA domain-containing protein
MNDRATQGRRAFRRSFRGYRQAEVDQYVAEVEAARSAWSAEVERLRKVEPLARLGDDVAELLTSFATSVVTLQDRLTEEAERRKADAEEYAAKRMADADRLLEMARAQARELSGEIIRQAQAEIAVLADQQLTIADALERAAQGIAASKQAIAKISPPALGVVADRGGDGPAPQAAPPPGDAQRSSLHDVEPARWATG